MKRIAAIVLALILALSLCASYAEEDAQWCFFTRPDGVELYPLDDFSADLAPEGLEGMYAIMTDANDASNVHIFAMPNGRVLMSVACYTVGEHGTVQDLYDNWGELSQELGKNAQSIDLDISCASLETRYGFDALCVNTEMVPMADPSLTLIMEGVIFYDGVDMFESWVVYPIENNLSNIPLLQDDIKSLEELRSSLSFKGEQSEDSTTGTTSVDSGVLTNLYNIFSDASTTPEPEATPETGSSGSGIVFSAFNTPAPTPEPALVLNTPAPAATDVPQGGNSGNSIFFFNSNAASNEPLPVFESAEMANAWRYTDPEGYFTICLPEGAVVITPSTSTEEVAAERQRWADAYPNGGEIFDLFQQQMYEVPYSLCSIPQHGIVWQIAYEDDPVYANLTLEDYVSLKEPIRQDLEQRYGEAHLLDNVSYDPVSGLEHASLQFALRTHGRGIMYIVYACTDENGALREVDLGVVAGDNGMIDPAYATLLDDILSSLKYTNP